MLVVLVVTAKAVAVRRRLLRAVTVLTAHAAQTDATFCVAVAVKAVASCLGCGECLPLTRGRCYACYRVYMSDKNRAIAKANEKAVAQAARSFLTDLKSTAKGEPLRPQILKGFVDRIGGFEKFGDIVGEEFLKCSQKDPVTGAHDPSGQWKPQIAAKFAELALRTAGQEDDKESFDPASLTDDDLQSVLRGLLVEQVKQNEDFCRALIGVVMEQNPRLVHDAVDPPPVEAEKVERVDLSEAGLDEKDACDD